MKTKRTNSFTLLEILVGIALLLIASGVIGLKMHGAVQKKRFQCDLDRLQARMVICQKLAMAMQCDWHGELKKNEKGWVLETYCPEAKGKKFSTLRLHQLEILHNNKKLDSLKIDFFASGEVKPDGVLNLKFNELTQKWKMSELFQREEGKKEGPLRPNEE